MLDSKSHCDNSQSFKKYYVHGISEMLAYLWQSLYIMIIFLNMLLESSFHSLHEINSVFLKKKYNLMEMLTLLSTLFQECADGNGENA